MAGEGLKCQWQNLEIVFFPLCQHLAIPAPVMSHRVWSPVLSKHGVSLPHTLTCIFISYLALWPRPVPSGMLGLCYQDLSAQPPDSNWVSIPTVCFCLCVYHTKAIIFTSSCHFQLMWTTLVHGRERELMVSHRQYPNSHISDQWRGLPSGWVPIWKPFFLLKWIPWRVKWRQTLSTCYLIANILKIKSNQKESNKVPGMR